MVLTRSAGLDETHGTMSKLGKEIALWIVIGLLLVALFNLFQTSSRKGPQSTLAFSDFLADVNRGQVTDVTINGNNIAGHFTDGRAFATNSPNDPGLVNRANHRRAVQRKYTVAVRHPCLLVPNVAADWRMGVLHASHAGWGLASDGDGRSPGARARP